MLRNHINMQLVKTQTLTRQAQSSAQDPVSAQPPAPSSPQFSPAPAPDLVITPAPNQKSKRDENRDLVRKHSQDKLQSASTSRTTVAQQQLNPYIYDLREPVIFTKEEALDNLAVVLQYCNQLPHPMLSVAYNILGIAYHRLGLKENSTRLLEEAITYHHKALQIDACMAGFNPMYLHTASVTYNYIEMVNYDLANLASALYHENAQVAALAKALAKNDKKLANRSAYSHQFAIFEKEFMRVREQQPSSVVSNHLNFQQPPIKIAQENNHISQSTAMPSNQGIFGRKNSRQGELHKNDLAKSPIRSNRKHANR